MAALLPRAGRERAGLIPTAGMRARFATKGPVSRCTWYASRSSACRSSGAPSPPLPLARRAGDALRSELITPACVELPTLSPESAAPPRRLYETPMLPSPVAARRFAG